MAGEDRNRAGEATARRYAALKFESTYASMAPLFDFLFKNGGVAMRIRSNGSFGKLFVATTGDMLDAKVAEWEKRKADIFFIPNILKSGAKAEDANITHFTCLRVDMDGLPPPEGWHDDASAGSEEWQQARAVMDALAAEGLEPWRVSCSGGGTHILYLLDKALKNVPESEQLYRDSIVNLSRLFPRGDSSIQNPARIWRAPCTTNRKPERNGAMCLVVGGDDKAERLPLTDAELVIRNLCIERGVKDAASEREEAKGAREGGGKAPMKLTEAEVKDLCFNWPNGDTAKRVKPADKRSGALWIAAVNLVRLGKSDDEITAFFHEPGNIAAGKLDELKDGGREMQRTIERARACAGAEKPASRPPKKEGISPEQQDEITARVGRIAFALANQGGSFSMIYESEITASNPLPSMNFDAFKQSRMSSPLYAVQKEDGKLVEMTDIEVARRNPGFRMYMGPELAPSKPVSTYENYDPANRGRYNLWKGFQYEARAPIGTPMDEAFVERVIRECICGGDDAKFEWTLSYIAHLVQRPWERPQCYLVIRGEKGTFKSFFSDVILELLDPSHQARPDGLSGISARFNDQDAGAIVMVADEANVRAESEWTTEKINKLVTGKTRNIEGKGKRMYQLENFLRLIILTNREHSAPASEDERRIVPYTTDNAYSELGDKGLVAGGDLWLEINNELFDKGGMEHFMYRMKNRSLENWRPIDFRRIPSFAEALREQASFEECSVLGWLYYAYNLNKPSDMDTPEGRLYKETEELFGRAHTPRELYGNFYVPYMTKYRRAYREEPPRNFAKKIRRIMPPCFPRLEKPSTIRRDLMDDDGVNKRMSSVLLLPRRDATEVLDAGGWLKMLRAKCKEGGVAYTPEVAEKYALHAAQLKSSKEYRVVTASDGGDKSRESEGFG